MFSRNDIDELLLDLLCPRHIMFVDERVFILPVVCRLLNSASLDQKRGWVRIIAVVFGNHDIELAILIPIQRFLVRFFEWDSVKCSVFACKRVGARVGI